MLVGVDELSKCARFTPIAEAGQCAVISDMGLILNSDPKTDVLITALSPAFIAKLLAPSDRPVTYVPLRRAFDGVVMFSLYKTTLPPHIGTTRRAGQRHDAVVRIVVAAGALVLPFLLLLEALLEEEADEVSHEVSFSGCAASCWHHAPPVAAGGSFAGGDMA